MLMVGSVGLGLLPGILAITFHATGMLAKFYAKAIDNVASAPVAALESAGDLAANDPGYSARYHFPV